MKTLYVVERTYPEDRTLEAISSPFTKIEKAREYAADRIHDYLDHLYEVEPGTARELHDLLHRGDYQGAIDFWDDYAEADDHRPRYSINTVVVDSDVLRKPLKVSAPCPTQEEISEGVILEQDGDYFQARSGPRVLARSTSEKQLFRYLRKLGPEECYPRIFEVNDHGNVTEYAYSGKEIGSWV